MLYKHCIMAILLIVYACEVPEGKSDISIEKGDQTFIQKLEKMDNPIGILPLRFKRDYTSSIVYQNENDYYSYFVFDETNALMILSDNPLYYICFPTKDSYFHLLSEYRQLSKKTEPSKKNPNSIPEEYDYGNRRLKLSFIPNEARYSSRGGELIDINKDNNDPEKLISIASKVGMFVPDFKEERIYNILAKRLRKLSVELTQVAAKVSFPPDFDASYLTYHIEPNIPLGFAFFSGEKLIVDEEESDKIAAEDFIMFCSVPLGNSQKISESYLSKTESGRNGFIITIRGDIEEFKSFLSSEGFPFDNAGELPVSLVLEDKFDEGLYLECSSKESMCYTISVNKGPDVPVKPDKIGDGRYYFKNIIRGNEYCVRAWRSERKIELLAESIIYCPKIIISELMFWGSSYRKEDGANDDDWIEIVNISTDPVNLSEYDFIIINTALTQNFWFGPSNHGTESHNALNFVLNPGERCVVALMVDDKDGVSGEFYFDQGCYPLDSKIVKKGTLSKNSIGKGYQISIYNNEKLVTNVVTSDKYGSKLPFTSMVRLADGEFATSKNDSGYPAGVVYEKRNFCSPGYAAPGEM
ncbi:MAG TPA: hypothetical protein P5123_00875 [Spirochaetota bacterium]|nr:hypothetical protein [Spirochaetota bacterium]